MDERLKGEERRRVVERNAMTSLVHRTARDRRPLGLVSIAWLGVLLVGLLVVSGCSENRASSKAEAPARRPAVPVLVAPVLQKAVPVQVRAIGTVEAYSTIEVKAQVDGTLMRVHLKEGQEVRKGELLFTIDPRPFEAALRQAEANLAKDMAQAKQAEANLAKDMAQAKQAKVGAQRYTELLKRQLVSQEEYDQWQTNADALEQGVRADQAALKTAEAAIGADRAAVERAQLQLEYCFIHSPIDGRTGNLLLHEGNLVKANDKDSILLVINQLSPISVTLAVPEQFLPTIQQFMAAGDLPVQAGIPQEDRPEQGLLTFVDNAVDRATGTIRLKGTLPNAEKRLWPGQFVDVLLTLTTQPDALVVPSQAIQTGQEGSYVFVVKPDLTVESRSVVVTRTQDGEAIIAQGLQPGETVVTDGQLRLTPGSRVEVKTSVQQTAETRS